MTRYVWNRELKKFCDKETGLPMPIKDENAICKPNIISDIEDYVSPVCGPDGNHKVIGGRAGQKEDLKAHGAYLMDPPADKASNSSRGFRNPKTAAANGVNHVNEEAVENAKKREKLHAAHKPVPNKELYKGL